MQGQQQRQGQRQ